MIISETENPWTQFESYALDGSKARIRRDDNEHGWWLSGDVVTEFGIVGVYAEEDHNRLDFAWGGRHYMQHQSLGRTARGLAIEATKFARRCVAESGLIPKARKA